MKGHCPDSRPLFVAVLPNYKLVFTGWSREWRGGKAAIKSFRGEKVRGAVYEVSEIDLKKLDRHTLDLFFNIVNGKMSKDPYLGMKLKGRYKDLWKYRIGDFKIIYSIMDKEVRIYILRIRHRSNVYDNIYY